MGKTKTYGAYPRNFPATTRWRVDYDYINRLSATDKAWLAKFSDEFYGGSFTDEPLHTSVAGRRACYRSKNSANVDAYEIHKVSGRLDYTSPIPMPIAGEQDQTPLLAYLDTPEYKRALVRYRAVWGDPHSSLRARKCVLKELKAAKLGSNQPEVNEDEDTWTKIPVGQILTPEDLTWGRTTEQVIAERQALRQWSRATTQPRKPRSKRSK